MNEKLGGILWWVQVIGPILTLVVVTWQFTSLRKSIYSSTYQRVYELMIAIDRFFIEHKELKPFIYPEAKGNKGEIDESGNDPDKISRDQLDSTIEMMVDYFDNVYNQRKAMPRRTFKGFSQFMREVYSHSEELQLFLKGKEERYPSKFVDHIRKPKK